MYNFTLNYRQSFHCWEYEVSHIATSSACVDSRIPSRVVHETGLPDYQLCRPLLRAPLTSKAPPPLRLFAEKANMLLAGELFARYCFSFKRAAVSFEKKRRE